MKVFLFIIVGIITKVSSVDATCYADIDPPLCDTCGGSCESLNGCNCGDGLKACVPTDCMLGSNDCCSMIPGLYYYDSILSCCTETFQCSPPCASDEICVDLNGTSDCHCNLAVYEGLGTKDLKPSVTCAGDAMTAFLSLCELEALGYNFSTAHLLNESEICVYAYSNIQNNIRMVNFPIRAAIDWCGNIAMEDSLSINFTNILHIDAYSGPIITKNPITYNVTCVYNRNMQTSLGFSLHPISSTITIPSGNGVSPYSVTLAAYSDESCTMPLQETDTLTVGSILYLGLFSPDLDGNTFSLRAQKCFATPTNDSSSNVNVMLVDGGCAVAGSVLTKVLENGQSTEARIKISSFLFQGYTDIFIFCSVTICNKSEECTKCDTARASDTTSPVLAIQLNLEDLNNFANSNSGHIKGVSWSLLVSTLLAYFYLKSL